MAELLAQPSIAAIETHPLFGGQSKWPDSIRKSILGATSILHTRQLRTDARPELPDALKACRAAFLGVGLMTAALNILYLTSSFFMLEIYDRVIPAAACRRWSAC